MLIVTATVPERWRFLDPHPRTQRRVLAGLRRLNAAIRALAADRAIPLLDVAGHPGLDDSANFAADGLHPSALGHTRAAREFERLLLERAHPRSSGGGRR